MPLATVTSKGQVTIPKSVRDRLQLSAGDQLDFVVEESGSISIRKRALSVDDVFGAFEHRGERVHSPEEMDESITRSIEERAG